MLALLLALCLPASAGTPAEAAAVSVDGAQIVAGRPIGAARGELECVASRVQHTVARCSLKAAEAPFARSLGHAVASVTLNLHFQGDVVNLSVELSGVSPAALVSELEARLGAPKVEYWADDEHLFASSIWVDGKTEVEVTQTVKGPPGKAVIYVSSLAGNRPLSPEDQAK